MSLSLGVFVLKRSALISAFSASWRFNLYFLIGNLGGGSPFANIAAALAEHPAEMTRFFANFANK